MSIKTTKFSGRNRGTAVCSSCGKVTWAERCDENAGMCDRCYEIQVMDNTISDGCSDEDKKEYLKDIEKLLNKKEHPEYPVFANSKDVKALIIKHRKEKKIPL